MRRRGREDPGTARQPMISPTSTIRERITYELLKPRKSPVQEWAILISAALLVAGVLAALIAIISSLVTSLLEGWI
jgi:hypothetical protein